MTCAGEKTFERQIAAGAASKERAAETRRRRKAGKAWFKVKEVFDSVCTEYIPVYTRYMLVHPGHIPVYTYFSQVAVWTVIFQFPTTGYHAMCMTCAAMQIQSSETSPKVWKIDSKYSGCMMVYTRLWQVYTCIWQVYTESSLNCVVVTLTPP